jgi:hypothetical protein
LTYYKQYDIIIIRKEVNTLSKQNRKKKSGNQKESLASTFNLIAAILNLAIAILLLIEKLTE